MLAAIRFTIDDKHVIEWMWVKKIRRKTLARGVFDRRWRLDGGKDTCQNIVRDLNLTLLILQWGGHCVVDHNPNTAVTFSVKCFHPLKLYTMPGNVFRKWLASYILFIYEHLIIMRSPTVNLIAVTTLLLTSGLHCC